MSAEYDKLKIQLRRLERQESKLKIEIQQYHIKYKAKVEDLKWVVVDKIHIIKKIKSVQQAQKEEIEKDYLTDAQLNNMFIKK